MLAVSDYIHESYIFNLPIVDVLMHTEHVLVNRPAQCPLYVSYEDVANVFINHVPHDPCTHGSDLKYDLAGSGEKSP